ncbi:hypothetical protein CBL_05976 [Carabus blaptoides fortunei]
MCKTLQEGSNSAQFPPRSYSELDQKNKADLSRRVALERGAVNGGVGSLAKTTLSLRVDEFIAPLALGSQLKPNAVMNAEGIVSCMGDRGRMSRRTDPARVRTYASSTAPYLTLIFLRHFRPARTNGSHISLLNTHPLRAWEQPNMELEQDVFLKG